MPTGTTRSLAVLTALALATGGVVTLAGGASAAAGGELVYGLTTDDRLVAFRSETPGTVLFTRDISFSGLQAVNEPNLLGIDVRPATGELYALGSNSQLYVVDPATGAATARGNPITPALSGSLFGFDVNPVADRIRIVSDANQNLRVHPDNGGASAVTPPGTDTDAPLRYLDTDPNAGQDPAVAAAAYTQNVAGATTTVQFDVDAATNALVQQNSNAGTLSTVGNLGVGDVTNAGLDVSASSDTTYAALAVTSGTPATTAYAFYTVNRTTGAATRVGAFGPAATTTTPALQVEDVAVASSRFLVTGATVAEGETVNVTIRRTGDTADSQSVTYALASGTTGVVPSDANPSTGTITFGPGETQRTFSVSTVEDDFTEGNEVLAVDLSSPTGGAVATDGTLTITDDEPGRAFGLTTDNGLTTFTVNGPGTATTVVPIGVAQGVQVLGIDVRPRTGDLYGVGSDNSVFLINPTTGQITNRQVLPVALDGTSFGVDFNPVADRLRIVSNNDQNLRVNVDNPAGVGTGTIVDGVLRYAEGDPNATVNPAVAAAAYLNSFNSGPNGTATPTATTQLDIDVTTASLVRQDSNPGTLTTRGPLGLAAGTSLNNPGQVGLDAAAAGNALFAVFSTSSTAASLYRVDETSGRATSLGVLATPSSLGSSTGRTIIDLALRDTDRATSTPPSASPSPSPSATATATASPTSTASPSPSQTPALRMIVLEVERDTITPGVQGVVRATGFPNAEIELLAYSRPSTEYRVVRTASLGADGRTVFRISPGTNTRLYARYRSFPSQQSESVVQNVATALSLTVVRNGSLDYTFQGRILPRRAGQLITLYRVDRGREVITSQIRTDSTGTYRIRRVFTGSGTFGFLTRTGKNLTNAAGVSNGGRARPTAIYAGPQR